MSLVNIEDAVSNAEVTSESQYNKLAFGIDFGTTNSVICLKEESNLRFFGDKDGILIPSVIAIDKNNQYILVGNDAIRKIGNMNYAVIYSVKRLIDTEHDNKEQIIGQNASIINDKINIFNQQYSVPDFIAYILTYLKGIAQKELQHEVSKAVITVPARFDDRSRNIIKIAAEAVGIEVIRIINEPTAAALAYGIDTQKQGVYVIYDFGGGTFDVSILRMEMGVFQVISTLGDLKLGGDDIDIMILKLLEDKTKKTLSITELKSQIKNIKHYLSYNDSVNMDIDDTIITITKSELENAIINIIEKTIKITESALADANKKEINLDLEGIVLVGGSSRIPLIKKMLFQRFKTDIFEDLNPDTIVALGAATKAYNLNHGNSNEVLIDVLPLSIGLEMMGGIVEKIIHRNSAIPISISQEFTTFKDNQTGIDLNIYQGERDLAKDCRLLGQLLVRNIKPMPAGVSKVLVNFTIDSDGILVVKSRESTTNQEQTIELKPSYGITIEDMHTMLYDSINNAQEDILQRLLIEAKTEAEQLIHRVEVALQKDKELLIEQELSIINDSIVALKNACSYSENKDEITIISKSLEEATASFAETRMQKYLKKALVGKNAL